MTGNTPDSASCSFASEQLLFSSFSFFFFKKAYIIKHSIKQVPYGISALYVSQLHFCLLMCIHLQLFGKRTYSISPMLLEKAMSNPNQHPKANLTTDTLLSPTLFLRGKIQKEKTTTKTPQRKELEP